MVLSCSLQWLRSVGVSRYILPTSVLPFQEPVKRAQHTTSAPFAASFFPLSLAPFSFAAENKDTDQRPQRRRCVDSTQGSVAPVAASALEAVSEEASAAVSAASASASLQLLCVPGDCTSIHRLSEDLTGLVVWPISASLCRFLHRHPLLVRGRSVLELGSGTGLVGLVAASLGAQCVLTDSSEPSLVLCKHNAQLNQLQHSLRVASLSWGDDDTELTAAVPADAASAASRACFDLVIGSDCAYKLSALDALFESVDLLLSRSASLSPDSPSLSPPLFLLSFQPRYDDTSRRLLTVAAHYLFHCYLVLDEAQVKEERRESAEELQLLHGAAVRLLDSGEGLLRLAASCILMFVRRLPDDAGSQ